MSETNQQPNQDKLGTPLKVLSFCIPLVGAIIYFTNKGSKPMKAKSACHAALWGFGLGILLNVLAAVLMGTMGSM